MSNVIPQRQPGEYQAWYIPVVETRTGRVEGVLFLYVDRFGYWDGARLRGQWQDLRPMTETERERREREAVPDHVLFARGPNYLPWRLGPGEVYRELPEAVWGAAFNSLPAAFQPCVYGWRAA